MQRHSSLELDCISIWNVLLSPLWVGNLLMLLPETGRSGGKRKSTVVSEI